MQTDWEVFKSNDDICIFRVYIVLVLLIPEKSNLIFVVLLLLVQQNVNKALIDWLIDLHANICLQSQHPLVAMASMTSSYQEDHCFTSFEITVVL